jgi:hypothetical protein
MSGWREMDDDIEGSSCEEKGEMCLLSMQLKRLGLRCFLCSKNQEVSEFLSTLTKAPAIIWV